MKKLVFIFLIFTFSASFVHAETIVSKTGRQYWHVSNAWVGGVIPSVNDRVIIRGNVSSHQTRTIEELIVEEGAVLQLSGSNLVVTGDVVNDGHITNSSLIPEGNVQSKGNITSVVRWRGGRDKQFLLAQDSIVGLYLESNITIGNDFTINDFRPDGHNIYAENKPTFFLGYLQQAINIQGEAVVHPTYRDTQFAYNIVAPDSTVHLQPSYINANYISVKDLIFQSGYYRSYSALSVRANTTTLLPGAYLNVSNGRLAFVGNIHNQGFFNNSKKIVEINGSIYNQGTWQTFRGPYITPFEETYPTVHYTQAASLYGLQDSDVKNTGYHHDVRSFLNEDTQAYLSFRGVDEEGFFTSWGEPYTINVPFATTTNTAKYTRGQNLEFSYIGANETREEFLIRISFDDETASGTVTLHTSRGRISPQVIEIKDGVWFGNVTVYEAGEHTNLFINSAQYYGKSNDFRVTDPIHLTNGGLRGVVYEQSLANKPKKENQVVYLYDEPNRKNLVATTTTSSSGVYSFPNLPCGKYYLSADSISVSPTESEVEVPCDGVTIQNLAFTQCSESSKTPVLLLPGIMGTDRVGNKSVYPELYKDVPYWGSGKLEIHNPQDIAGFDLFVNSLREEGYVEGCDLFIVSYEWSLSIQNIASLYLKPWINHAMQRSGKEKVSIVAHSMGGLVSRAYIQGGGYEKDVQQLVMVGTPNQGSTNSYFLWEGGDPVAADETSPPKNIQERIFGEYFYTNTINNNHLIKTGSNPLCVFEKDDLFAGIISARWNDNAVLCEREKTKQFLEEKAVSVGQLFPAYNFLLKSGDGYIQPNYENKLLKSLNNTQCYSGVCGYNFATTTDMFGEGENQVQMSLVAGTGQNTLKNILLSRNKKGNYLYTDGNVTYYDYDTDGDGTVLIESVEMQNYDVNSDTESGHIGLVGSAITKILKLIKQK